MAFKCIKRLFRRKREPVSLLGLMDQYKRLNGGDHKLMNRYIRETIKEYFPNAVQLESVYTFNIRSWFESEWLYRFDIQVHGVTLPVRMTCRHTLTGAPGRVSRIDFSVLIDIPMSGTTIKYNIPTCIIKPYPTYTAGIRGLRYICNHLKRGDFESIMPRFELVYGDARKF